MSTYKIITDSACDLPQTMLRELDVAVAPLTVNFRGENRPDSVADAEVKELYDAMRAGEVATTAAANPDCWASSIEPALAAGFDVLVLAFSGGLSTTYQSAVIAAADLAEQYPDRKVTVVDTCAAALGQGDRQAVTGDGLHDRGDHGDVQGDRGLFLTLAVLGQRGAQRNICGNALGRGVAGDQQVFAEGVAGFGIIVGHWLLPPKIL